MGHVSPSLAHLGLLQLLKYPPKSQKYSGLPKCHSRQPLQKGQSDPDRKVLTFSNVQSDLQSLAQTNGRHVCLQNVSQTFTLCLTSTLKIDALNILWEGLDGYVFCPVALIPKVIQKMNTYKYQMIVVAPGWPRIHTRIH